MFKGKVAVLCLVTAALLTVAGMAFGGIIDPCRSYVELVVVDAGPPNALLICPVGDTDSLYDQGWFLWILVIDTVGVPVGGVPAVDFWLVDCDPVNAMILCGGSAASNADSSTSSAGWTSMSLTSVGGGGCADGVAMVVQGFVVEDSLTNCTTVKCLNVNVRSPDMNGDLNINLIDLTQFAAGYPPQPYLACADLNVDGLVNLIDLTILAAHYGPPGHACN